MRYHSVVGHLHVPNLVARVPHDAGGYLVRTNSSGFRSDLEFEERVGERPRILVFGDSFTAGEGCDNRERYPEILGRTLNAEVYNFGLSGSAPDQHILMYQEFGRSIDADLIIWGISIHNIERVLLAHRPSTDRVTGKPVLVPKPYFTLENGALRLHHVPVPRARPDLEPGREREYAEEGHIDPPLLERLFTSPVLAGVRNKVKRSLPGLKEHVRGLAYRIADIQMYDDYLDEGSPGWSLLSALIRKFRIEVKGIPILIVPLPTYHYYVDRLRPAYQDLFDTLEDPDGGLFVCNITNGLHAGKNLAERKAICFPADVHYSPYGHQEIARLIAREIRRRQLLPNQKNSAERIKSGTNDESITGRYVLGLTFGAEDSAAALVRDGEIIAIAQEDSFSRVEKQGGYPHLAANYCLEAAGINQTELSAVAYGGLPYSELESDVRGLLSNASKEAWCQTMANWVRHDLNTYPVIRSGLQYDGMLLESGYSMAQCAAAFYSSPYTSAAVICFHGDKHRATATIGVGSSEGLKLIKESPAPHNLLSFYLEMARFISGRISNDELHLWTLAEKGVPDFADNILNELIDLKKDGSVVLNPKYFADPVDTGAPNDALERFFGIGQPNGQEITSHVWNLARSVQAVCCEAVVRTARLAREITGETKLCISGSLICDPEVRRALLDDGCFDEVWVQPVIGHANAALGAALRASYGHFDIERSASLPGDFKKSIDLLGPEFSPDEIDAFVDTYDFPATVLDSKTRANRLAAIIAKGQVVGHFSGRLGIDSESMGDRLILIDVRSKRSSSSSHLANIYNTPGLAQTIAVPESDGFTNESEPWRQVETSQDTDRPNGGLQWARALCGNRSPGVHNIIREFEVLTGCNTIFTAPFKMPKEPIVCTPLDAYRCFMLSDMDVLVLGNRMLLKEEQPAWPVQTPASSGELSGRRRTLEDELTSALDELYERKCKAVVRKDQDVDVTESWSELKRASSHWIECERSNTGQLATTVRAKLEQVNSKPGKLASIVVGDWSSGSLQAGFRPILIRLIRLHRRLVSRGLL